MADQLKAEFEYFLTHQQELVERYNGKFLVIKDQNVIGVYDNQLSAVTETQKSHELGTFLVQQAIAGKEAYTRTFHSRVA